LNYDLQPLLLTVRLAAATTVILLIIGVPFAYWLASTSGRLKPVVEALVSLPLVLPPSVLGFYLLLSFSPQYGIGAFLDRYLGTPLVFTFEGLVIASVIASFPFMVQPVQSGFRNLPASLREAAYTLGLSWWQTLWRVQLPNVRPALLAGTVLTFAHTVGEFGVVLMIGGGIPGETRTASIAIYDQVEALNYGAANFYALVLVALCFAVLLLIHVLNRPLPGVMRP
jgi:molybdate transport system permease protein